MEPIELRAGEDFLRFSDYTYYESDARAGCVRNTDLTLTVSSDGFAGRSRCTLDQPEFRRFVRELDRFSRGEDAAPELRDPERDSFLRFERTADGGVTVRGLLCGTHGEQRLSFRCDSFDAAAIPLLVYRLKFWIFD